LLASPIPGWIAGDDAKDNATYVAYAQTQMEQRLVADPSSLDNRKDFMYYLISAKDPQTGRGFTHDELSSEASLLISAGSDTTSITLCSTMFYLLHNPGTLHNAVTEVRLSFNSVDDIPSGTERLKFLRACIDEALRLVPPVPSHLPREILSGGMIIDGQHFPQGTVVGVSTFAIHRNPNYYPKPLAFWPERWIVDKVTGVSEESVANAKAAFCPFSIGQRGCIGKQVAYLELLIAMATLLFTYDLQLPIGLEGRVGTVDLKDRHGAHKEVTEYQFNDVFLAEKEGPIVQFRVKN
jgi:cytochrome P450